MRSRTLRTHSLALLIIAASAAHGQIYTWTDQGDSNNWSDRLNWSGLNRPPTNSYATELVFDDDADGVLVNDLGTLRLKSLSLLNRGYRLRGDALAFAGGGLLRIDGGESSVSNNIVVNANGSLTNRDLTVQVDGYANSTLSGVVSGNGRLVKTGAYVLTLSGLNTYTGGTLLRSGTVSLGSDGALGNGDLTLAGGRLQMNGRTATVKNLFLGDGNQSAIEAVTSPGRLRIGGDVTLNAAPNERTAPYTLSPDLELLAGDHIFGGNGNRTAGSDVDLTLSGTVSGTGRLVKDGESVLSLKGTTTYAGGTTIRAGGLNVLNLLGDYANDGALGLTNAAEQTYGGTISGKGSFAKNGAGTLTLNAAQTYTGGTTVTDGTLKLTADGQLAPGSKLTVVSNTLRPTLNLNGTHQTFGSVNVNVLANVVGGVASGDAAHVEYGSLNSGLTVSSGNLAPDVLRLGDLVKTGPDSLFLLCRGDGSYIANTVVRGGKIVTADPFGALNPLAGGSLTLAGGDLEVYALGGHSLTYTDISLGDGTTTGRLGNVVSTNINADRANVSIGFSYTGRPNGVFYNGAAGRTSDPAVIGSNIDFQTFDALELGGNGNRSNGDEDVTIAGALRNDASNGVVKTGPSVYRLQGITGYTGGTTVNGGTLIVERPAGRYVTNADLRFETSVSNAIGDTSGSGDLTKTGKGTLSVDGVLGNAGRLDILGGSVVADGEGVYGGALNLAKGARFANFSGGTVEFARPAVVNGSFTTDEGSTTMFDGLVSGAGRFAGFGAVEFRGGYSPGNSPASVEIESAVTFASDLTMELAGTTLGAGYDHLTLDSLATLGGGLNVRYYGGFQASAGQSFDLFDWDGGLAGRFSFVSLPTLGDGLAWDTSTLYTSGVIRVQSVPEPSAFALLGLGFVGVLRRRRRA